MPIESSVNKNETLYKLPNGKTLTENDCLLLLRKRECLAYHHICEVFRAQGHLTPEKLKLLKEIAAALYIPDVRHRAECRAAVNSEELSAIADCVSGPNNDLEWRREGREFLPPRPDFRIATAAIEIADAVAEAVTEAWEKLEKSGSGEQKAVTKPIVLKRRWFEDDAPESTSVPPKTKTKAEVKKEVAHDSCSSVSSATKLSKNAKSTVKIGKPQKTTADTDKTLMPPPPPPPPPIVTAPPPPPAIIVPSPSPVITVPPPTSITVIPTISKPLDPQEPRAPDPVSSSSSLLQRNVPSQVQPSATAETKVSQEISQPQVPELENSHILTESEEVQFVSFSESLDSSLPPLVVVPPAEPVITVPHSSSFSPPLPTSTLVLPSGMSIQLREDNGDAKKRKHSLSQDSTPSMSSPKSVASTQLSKVAPVMVSAGISNQGQVKVTPVMSRSRMATTTQPSYSTPLAGTAQKVIIVSNSSSNAPILQHSLNMPVVCSVGMPITRASPSHLQPAPGVVHSNSGVNKLRHKVVTVPAKCRAKGSPLVIPMGNHNLQLKNTITLKQDKVTVVDTGVKRLPVGSGPAKILPKPQGSMFIVNSTQGPHKITTTMGGGQAARMFASRVISQSGLSEGASSTTLKSGGPKQNVVILQKPGGNQRTLTLTNTTKDFMQKLISKKCVVIQSSKVLPKNVSPKPIAPVSTSSTSNVVVLDLSQEQYRQNLSSTTIAEILQASGIVTSPAAQAVTTATPHDTSASALEPPSLLPEEAKKELPLEEVMLPVTVSQSESIVTLDEAVEMLDEGQNQQQPVIEPDTFNTTSTAQPLQMEVTDASEQIFTISSDLGANDITFMGDKSLSEEPATSQVVIETLPADIPQIMPEVDNTRQTFQPHRDGAVTIQHSNTDMPANMSLEEYTSQQMENQGLN